MNKIYLMIGVATLLSTELVNESRAETSCPEGQTCTQCGDDCLVYLTDDSVNTGKKIANIIGTGDMWNAEWKNNNYYYGDNISPIYSNRASITSVQFAADSNITSIGQYAFYNTYDFKSITIPDSVTSIGDYAFYYASSLTEIIIPDSWADSNHTLAYGMFYSSCFSRAGRPAKCPTDMSNVKIVCQGDTNNCKQALAKFGATGSDCPVTPGYCLDSDVQVVTASDYNQCTGVGYIWKNNACSRKTEEDCTAPYVYDGSMCKIRTQAQCTGEGYAWSNNSCKYTAPIVEEPEPQEPSTPVAEDCQDGYEFKEGEGCVDKYPYSKKHWTPAEANQWLKDENNTITITFKKQ